MKNYLRSALLLLLCLCLNFVAQSQETKITPISIVPKPVSLEVKSGFFNLNVTTKLQFMNADRLLIVNADFYHTQILPSPPTKTLITNKTALDSNVVILTIDKNMKGGKESYVLDITPQQIRITSPSSEGIFYGVQSLKQLYPLQSNFNNGLSVQIPALHIADSPRFAWRGMHLDVSRHFYSIEYLHKFVDMLALYKLNTFHLHLTDDQGWRLQIDKYPKLTDQGAWRELNDQDSSCLEMAKTNPDFELPESFFKEVNGKRMYGGFYTKQQIRELIQYAAQRKITIVPEIDMPGHMMAAIKAYPGLTCMDETGWGKTFSTPLCPCKENVYAFLQDVMTEVIALFPSPYIHIGADEVEKTTWANSDACKQLMEREGIKDVNELQSYFVKRMERFLNSKGKRMIGWDEVLEGGVNPSTTVMYWRGWVKDAPKIAAAAGNKVIMTPTDYSYFDYAQDANTLKKLYNARVIPEGLTPEAAKNIIGVQGNIWTEYIPSTARLEYMVFPRILAMSELGWSATKDYADFDNRMQQQYVRLEAMQIKFRIPDISNLREQMVFTDTISLTLQKPAMLDAIRYTLDGSEPTVQSTAYTRPIRVQQKETIKVAGFLSTGRRGDVSTIHFDKQTYLPPVAVTGALQLGLSAAYYNEGIKNLKHLSTLSPATTTHLTKLEIPAGLRKGSFGILYSGFIKIPVKGIYTFYLNADDGASLTIGDRLVIDNDGPHAPKEKNGQIALEAGLHPFLLPFFEAGGGFTLELRWEGPGFEKQMVVPANFFSVPKKEQ